MHLKPLFLKGHINGSPVARMLVDGGAVVNLMPYSVFKKLGLRDEELIKTNMVLNGFEGKEKTKAKGVMYVELTVGSKTLATTFFVAEVQGNYNVILGRDWVHANQCVPSTMHQFLIQWLMMKWKSFMRIIRLVLLWPMHRWIGNIPMLLA